MDVIAGMNPLQRLRLLEIVYAIRPRIIILWAPPGYGKSVLAKQITANIRRVIEVDCQTAHTAVEFSRVLINALGSDASETDALAAWHVGGRNADVVVFENADGLEDDALRLLRLCLQDRGGLPLIILCTRTHHSLLFKNRIGPTDILTIDERDLRFMKAETAAMFGSAVTKETLEQIQRFTEGWPIAVEICRRAARAGHLNGLLNDPLDLELGQFDAYIASEVVGRLREPELNALALLSLDAVDLSLLPFALRLSQQDTDQLVRRLPLVRREETRYTVHKLLALCVARHHAERRRNVAENATAALAEAGESVAAARVAFAAGDLSRAAGVLNPGVLFMSPPLDGVAEFARVLDRATLVRHPLLWTAAILYRQGSMSDEDWRTDSLIAWTQLPHDAPHDVLLGVANNVLLMLVATGAWEHLGVFRREIAKRFAHARIPTETTQALAALFDGLVAVGRMLPLDLDRMMADVAPLLATDYVRAFVLREIVAPIHARRGDRDGERDVHLEAIRAAKHGRVSSILAGCLQDAAIAAWFAGEDDLFQTYLAEIEELAAGDAASRVRVAHFLDCVRGEALANEHAGSRTAKRAIALLIGAERTSNTTVQRAIVQQAVAAADASQTVVPMIVTRLAAACIDEHQHFRIDEVRKILDNPHGTTIFHRHLTSRHGASPLEPFLRRFRAPSARRPALRVMLLQGTVRLDDTVMSLSTREFMLLAYLALQRRPVSLDALVDALWPQSPGAEGVTSLRVYVNRIRKRIGDPDVIRSTKHAYGVGAHVVTDVAEAELTVAQSLPIPRISAIEPLLALRAALVAGPPAWVANLSGFHVVYPRINELLDRLDEALASARPSVPLRLQHRIDAALDAESIDPTAETHP